VRRGDHPRPKRLDRGRASEELVWLIRRLLEADENTYLRAARGRRNRGLIEKIGREPFAELGDGMFVWARFPHVEDSLALSEASQRDGIMLAPGTVFRPHLERSPWMRFNVAVCEDTRVQRWLRRRLTAYFRCGATSRHREPVRDYIGRLEGDPGRDAPQHRKRTGVLPIVALETEAGPTPTVM
jgi:hypothetical protein